MKTNQTIKPGQKYTYQPCILDRAMSTGSLVPGSTVTVINWPKYHEKAPGMCYVNGRHNKPALVCLNSLK